MFFKEEKLIELSKILFEKTIYEFVFIKDL
jgi:hypothetical protein